jgi:rare lipoprotein A
MTKVIVVTAGLCYYRHVRRRLLILSAILFLSGCGRKTVQITVPGSAPVAVPSGELEGLASYYAEPYHGRRTANGEIFDTYNGMTAAHRTLPFDSVVVVTNKNNGREVEVRINDRGPFIDGRVIDLSLVAARKIDMVRAGVVPVKVKVVRGGTPARASSRGAVYAVQVGAFESQRSAEELKRQLEKKYPAVSVQTTSGGKTIFRVRVGREPDLLSAEKLAEKLRGEKYDSFVVRAN